MKPEPSIFDQVDEAADAEAVAEGIAGIEAGQTISHKAMKAWLQSWGTPEETPPPKVGD